MPLKIAPKASKKPLKHGSKPAKKKPSPKDFSRQISEHEVHLHCWQWVQNTYPELLIFHVPNGGNRNIAEAQKFKRMGVVPGVADFLMFLPTCNVAIELKDEGGKQSDAQRHFQKRWEKLGHRYEVARSLTHFQEIIDSYHHAAPWPWASYNENPSP